MESSPELLVLSGLPASGKTTAAKEWLAVSPETRRRINYDELRVELFGPNWRFNRVQENEMQAAADAMAKLFLLQGLSVVVDNTNLTTKSRNHWKQLGEKCGATVVFQEFDTPIWECKLRDQKREGRARVGWAVIDRMALFNGFIDWNGCSCGEIVPLKPEDFGLTIGGHRSYCYAHPDVRFIVVDMDGTLADCEWRRHHLEYHITHKMGCTFADKDQTSGLQYVDETGRCRQCLVKSKKDWKSFFAGCIDDPPNEPILRLVKHLCYFGYQLIIVSGRPMDQCGMATEMWLRKHLTEAGVHVHHLFMRDSFDGRSDVEVKQEICDLLPKDRIAYVLDDRESVCNQVWRAAGLTCLQPEKEIILGLTHNASSYPS